jgi:ActR/RegA family two-component response regulator
MTETVLIVDDEESVRRTFQEWLDSSGFGATVFSAVDAESALRIVNEHSIDLAILDWNLGSGSDGLQLLEDIVEFQPDVVAILITGFAGIATPLQALRMGVRDYLDKNADLTRETFLLAVRKQLDRIRPTKQQRELNLAATQFRAAVENVLPLVRTASAFNDPVPLPEAVRGLLRLVVRVTGATDAVIIARHMTEGGAESVAIYGADGESLPVSPVPFSRSLASSVLSFQEPVVLQGADLAAPGPVELMPFEIGRQSLLATAVPVGSGIAVVLELFDKPAPGFTTADRQLIAAAAEVGGGLLRLSLAERQTHRLLFDAVDAALRATNRVADMTSPGGENPLPAMMESLKESLRDDVNASADADTTLRLVEAVRALSVRHGTAAVEHCVKMVLDLKLLLDGITGD